MCIKEADFEFSLLLLELGWCITWSLNEHWAASVMWPWSWRILNSCNMRLCETRTYSGSLQISKQASMQAYGNGVVFFRNCTAEIRYKSFSWHHVPFFFFNIFPIWMLYVGVMYSCNVKFTGLKTSHVLWLCYRKIL